MRKLKNISLLLCLVFSVHVRAQTFLKYFAIDSAATTGSGIIEKGGYFYACGAVTDTAYNWAIKSYMAKFDGQGNMLWSKTYRPSWFASFYFLNQADLVLTMDGGFVAAGSATDTNGVDSVLLSKFDTSGNLLFYRTIAPNILNYRHAYGLSIVEYDSAFYIIGDVQLSDYYVALMLIKTDLSGNLQFIKTYQNLPLLYGSVDASICGLQGDELLLVDGRSDWNVNYWQIDYSTCFLEVDTTGNIIHQYCSTDSNTQANEKVATTYDGNYLSSGSYFQIRGTDQPGEMDIKYLAKWDTSFNKIWEFKTGGVETGNAFYDFKLSPDNDIILCGQNIADTGLDAGFHGTLARVNKDGTRLWFRDYKVPTGLTIDGNENSLVSICTATNGDIAAVGTWASAYTISPLYFQEVGWILRVDSNGCLGDTSCGVTTDLNEPFGKIANGSDIIRVFPNPSNGVFTVNIMSGLPAATTIDVFDDLGRKLHTQLAFNHTNLVNLYHLPSGIYFYKVGNGLVNVGEGKLVIQK